MSSNAGQNKSVWKEEIRQRLANLRLAPTREAEIVEELGQHLKDCYEELRSTGATNEEASRVALAQLNECDLLMKELERWERPAPQCLVLGSKGAGT